MAFIYQGKRYRSKKFPLLEYIFNQRTDNGTKHITENHTFTLADISDAYKALGIPEPASISNTILDLTRKDSGIGSRLPLSLIEYGYDLRKKTGIAPGGASYAGEFVYVGLGNALQSWHLWRETPDCEIVLPNTIPQKIVDFLSDDEGALFSAIDYCDVLSLALYNHPNTIIRVQNPVKWQPNEIDGLYFSDYTGTKTLYPSEAKALSTGDHINLEQMLGAYHMVMQRIPNIQIIPLGLQMITNGIRIGVFKEKDNHLEIDQYIQVTFDPPIKSWRPRSARRRKASQ